MLILTRKAEQGIVIDGKVVVRLLSIDGERVKIGIEAPRSVSVLREELLEAVADQNQAAARFRGHQGLTDAFKGAAFRARSAALGPVDAAGPSNDLDPSED